MPRPYDPRAPYPNPLIRDITRVIRANFRGFQSARAHEERRGYAAVLVAALEQYLEQPEPMPPDLQPGAISDARARLRPEELGPQAGPFLDAYPHDAPGSGLGRCFFSTYAGRMSPLFEGPARDPRDVGYFHGFGMSFALELRHATKTATTRHAVRDEPLRWVARDAGLPAWSDDGEVQLILADPRGYECPLVPDPLVVAMTGDLAAAITAADAWSATLDVRLIVATRRITFDNH